VQESRIRHYIDDVIQSGFPIVFHPINFNVALSVEEDSTVVERVRDIARYCGAVWTGQDIGVWTDCGQYLGPFLIPAILDRRSVAEVVAKVRFLNEVMPCPFLIENPPVGFSIETMHILDFMSEVSSEADCGMVLDIGHLIGYQQATRRAPDDMPLSRFPFDRVVEIHVAGLQFSKVGDHTNIIDQHAYPVHDLCWQFLERHAFRMSSLRGITLEQEFCQDELVLKHLRKARTIVSRLGLFQHA
jgi:uncharacterized protein (UPF0276 family)